MPEETAPQDSPQVPEVPAETPPPGSISSPQAETAQTVPEPAPAPAEAPPAEIQTAQTRGFEPIGPEETPSQAKESPRAEESPQAEESPREEPPGHSARERSILGNARKQEKRREKLDKIVEFLNAKTKNGSTSSPQVTNDEVEKLLHVSDATATRYLSALEKEGKIRQIGKMGTGVAYTKI